MKIRYAIYLIIFKIVEIASNEALDKLPFAYAKLSENFCKN